MLRATSRNRLRILRCFSSILRLWCFLLFLKGTANAPDSPEERTNPEMSREIQDLGQLVRAKRNKNTHEPEARRARMYSHSRLLNQQEGGSIAEGCSLDATLISRVYDEPSETWTVNDSMLREIDNDLQRIVDCAFENDTIYFRTRNTIQPETTMNISIPLTLRGERGTTLNCPQEGALLISRSSRFTMDNFVISGCNGTSSIIVLSPNCNRGRIQAVSVLTNIRFLDNAVFEKAHIIEANSSCLELEIITTTLRENKCVGTHCVLLGSRNTLRGIRLLRNGGSNDTSLDSSIFFATIGSETSAIDVSSRGNTIGSIRISNGSINITNSHFEDNNATSGAAIMMNSTTLGHVDQCSFVRNLGQEREGGAIRAIASNVNISSSVFRENDAPSGGSISFDERCNSSIGSSTFENNTVPAMGGAIFANSFSTILLFNSSFLGNRASWGGALNANHRCNISVSGIDCVMNRASTGGCLYFVNSCTVRITSSRFYNNSVTSSGGAIELYSNVEFFMYSSTLDGNSATTNGGGLAARSTSTLQVRNVRFVANEALRGGVFHLTNALNARVDNSIFANNTSFRNGGAIDLYENSSIAVNNSTFSGNKARFGGGMIIWNNSTAVLLYNSFARNNASTSGGVVYLQASNMFLISSQLESNNARFGGSIYAFNASMVVTNTTIYRSHAMSHGGGIYMRATNASMETTRLESNEAAETGGGIALVNASSLLCFSCLILNNRAFSGAGLYAFSNNSVLIVAQFQSSRLENNSARSYGGGIEFVEPQERDTNCTNPNVTCGCVILLNTSFVDNYANHSGAVLLTTDPNKVLVDCEYRGGQGNEFLNETTVNLLKAIDPRQLCPSWVRNSVSSSAYGYAVGTYGQVMELLIDPHADVKLVRDGTNRYVLENVSSGRQLPTINVTILDQYGQGPAPTLPYTFEARLFSEDGFFRGLHLRNITAGSGNFPEVAGFALPGNYTIEITSNNPSIEMLVVKVSVRECQVGEESTRDGLTCQRCDAFSYNFNISEVGGCKECPNDATCKGRYIVPNEGSWHNGPCHEKVQECLVEEACTYENRVEAITNSTHDFTNCDLNGTTLETYRDGLCNKGYEGPLCGSCKIDYGLSFLFQCVTCPHKVVSFLVIVGVFSYLLGVAAFTIRGCLPFDTKTVQIKLRRARLNESRGVSIQDPEVNIEMVKMIVEGHVPPEYFRKKQNEASTSQTIEASTQQENKCELTKWKMTEIFKIMINFLQTTAVAASLDLDWSDGMNGLFEASEYIGALSTVLVSRPSDCIASSATKVTRLIWRMLLGVFVPAFVILTFATMWAFTALRNGEDISYFGKRTILSAFAVTYISYLGLTEMAVKAFYCVDVYDSDNHFKDSKSSYLATETSVECYKNDHFSLIAIAVIVLAVVTVSFPLALGGVLSKHKQRLMTRDSWTFETTGFLFRAFKESCLYWESLVMLRKACLSVIVVFSYSLGGLPQGILALLVLLTSLYIHVMIRPYRKEFESLNTLESFSLLVSCLTFTLGLFFTNDVSSDSVRAFLSIVLILTNTLFFMFLLFVFCKSGIDHLRVVLQDENVHFHDQAPWWRVLKVFITIRCRSLFNFSSKI